MAALPSYDPSTKAKKTRTKKDTLRSQLENAVEDQDEEYGYGYWLKEIAQYNKTFKAWESRVDKIGKIVRNSDTMSANPQAQFNITKSVFDTLSPAIFTRVPRPDVSRRYRDIDPAARVASLLLERTLEYEIMHHCDFKDALISCMSDYLQAARAVAFVRYEPHIRAKEMGEPNDGYAITEDIDMPDEELVTEQTTVDFVHYKDFGHNICRTWQEVHSVWRVVYMDRPALIARFGEELGNKIPLDSTPDDDKKSGRGYMQENKEQDKLAKIYEIWCKNTKKVHWLSKSMGKIIDVKDDPLGLEEFFPIPKPLYMNLQTSSLEPVPLFNYFRDQQESLNILAERQRRLIDGLRVRGVYNAAVPELARLFSEGEDNTLIPADNWAAFSEANGLKGSIDIVDITPLSNALVQSFEAMEQLKQQVYDITGVADVMRGVSDPNETASAQVIKSTHAQGRLKNMQLAVVRFATEILQIKAQIICQHYADETIMQAAGAPLLSPQDKALIPQALQILRNDSLRGFRIEVSSDAMVLLDEQQEKADRVEFITAIGGYIEKMAPMMANAPEIAPLVTELMKFGAAAYKAGKVVEGVLDEMADQARQQAEASRGQPKPPPPEIQKLQMEQQADAQKFQAEAQMKQQEIAMQMQHEKEKAQLDAQVEQAKQEAQAAEEAHRTELEAQRAQFEMQMQAEIERQKQEHEMAMMQQKEMFARNTAIALELIKSNSKIDVERVKASLDDGASEEIINKEVMDKALESPFAPIVNAVQESNSQTQDMMRQMMEAITKPKVVKRGPDGRIAEVH